MNATGHGLSTGRDGLITGVRTLSLIPRAPQNENITSTSFLASNSAALSRLVYIPRQAAGKQTYSTF